MNRLFSFFKQCSLIVLVILLAIWITQLTLPEHKIKVHTNAEIISYYKNNLESMDNLDTFAKVICQTHYSGIMYYSVNNSDGRHVLHGRPNYDSEFSNLNDTFPQVRNTIVSLSGPDPYSLDFPQTFDYCFYYYKKIILIETDNPLRSLDTCETVIVFSELPENEIINDCIFDGYTLYADDEIPQVIGSWIFKIKDNWYICSTHRDDFVSRIIFGHSF